MENKGKLFCFFLTALFLSLYSCSWFPEDSGGEPGSGSGGGNSVTVTVSPSGVTVIKGEAQQFNATVNGSYSSSVTWSVAGNSVSATAISQGGLLRVAANESAGTLTVKAAWSSGGGTVSGTAAVTLAVAQTEIPSSLRITKPEKTGLNLSWNALSSASSYKVYRAAGSGSYAYLGAASAASYRDTAVTAGSSYYYTVSAVVNGLETGRSAPAFGFAEEYFALPAAADKRLVPLAGNQKHYYRFPVTSGTSYTIYWENGNSQNADTNVLCSAWQNDGTAIFANQRNGYTAPQAFTAASAGYITVAVENSSASNRYNYAAYCLKKDGGNDAGVVALPPAMVTGMRVSAPAPSSITLGWNPVPDAVKYNIYRSPAGAAPVLLGSSNAPSYTDSAVSAGAAYYYTLAPVNAGGKEGVWAQGAFAYAASHFALQDYSSSPLMHLPAGSKHYYRFALNTGQNITVTWENGNSQNADANVLCSAWQNDGTAIFTGRRDGYTAPQAFTAAVTGYITLAVENGSGFTGYGYRIYYNNN